MDEAEIVALQTAMDEANSQIQNLTAERDSLAEELEKEKARVLELQTENAATKKLNFTLARQLDTKPKKSFDETLISLYGKEKNQYGH